MRWDELRAGDVLIEDLARMFEMRLTDETRGPFVLLSIEPAGADEVLLKYLDLGERQLGAGPYTFKERRRDRGTAAHGFRILRGEEFVS